MRWKRPTYATIYRILTHPAYGGAYAYGKTESASIYEGGSARKVYRRRPKERWLALIPHAHEGYITWEQFQQIQRTLAANVPGAGEPGAAKRGASLLAGLLRCRRCGRKLTVQYTGSNRNMLRYCCDRGRLDQGAPKCIAFGGVTVDEEISRQLLRVVRPAAVEAAVLAHQDGRHQRDEVRAALQRDLEAARYAARGREAVRRRRPGEPHGGRRTGVPLGRGAVRVHDLERRLATEEDSPDASADPMPDEFADPSPRTGRGLAVAGE